MVLINLLHNSGKESKVTNPQNCKHENRKSVVSPMEILQADTAEYIENDTHKAEPQQVVVQSVPPVEEVVSLLSKDIVVVPCVDCLERHFLWRCKVRFPEIGVREFAEDLLVVQIGVEGQSDRGMRHGRDDAWPCFQQSDVSQFGLGLLQDVGEDWLATLVEIGGVERRHNVDLVQGDVDVPLEIDQSENDADDEISREAVEIW